MVAGHDFRIYILLNICSRSDKMCLALKGLKKREREKFLKKFTTLAYPPG